MNIKNRTNICLQVFGCEKISNEDNSFKKELKSELENNKKFYEYFLSIKTPFINKFMAFLSIVIFPIGIILSFRSWYKFDTFKFWHSDRKLAANYLFSPIVVNTIDKIILAETEANEFNIAKENSEENKKPII